MKARGREHPGVVLRALLKERGMGQAELCRWLGRPAKTINQIIKGKADISPRTALQLEAAGFRTAWFWVEMQARYDLALAAVGEK